jgi:mRNA interferase MazF
MQRGEIYLARFPFGDVPGMKLRPVLLLTGTVGSVPEVLVAYVSSVLPAQPLSSDLSLDPAQPEFRTTNLKVPSALSKSPRRDTPNSGRSMQSDRTFHARTA